MLLRKDNIDKMDASGKISPKLLHLNVNGSVRALREKAVAHFKTFTATLKVPFVYRVQEIQALSHSTLFLLSKPPLSATMDNLASSVVVLTYNKFVDYSIGPIKVIDVQSCTVITNTTSICDTVSINQATYATALSTVSSLIHPYNTRM